MHFLDDKFRAFPDFAVDAPDVFPHDAKSKELKTDKGKEDGKEGKDSNLSGKCEKEVTRSNWRLMSFQRL
jgi:hypothetical protein